MKKVIVRLGNGLGNQLFTYAAAYSFAKKNNSKLFVDDESGFYKRYKYELHNFNISAPIIDRKYKFLGLSGRIKRRILQKIDSINNNKKFLLEQRDNEKFTYYDDKQFNVNFKNVLYFEGFFQSEKYFHDEKENLKNEFTFKKDITNQKNPLIDKMTNENSVSIHIRQSKFLQSEGHKNLNDLNKNYFRQSMEICKRGINYFDANIKNPKYFVWSNNFDGLREYFPSNKFIFVDVNLKKDPAYDLYLMSLCKHFVLSLSTLHYWGAYFSKYMNKICIAPPYVKTISGHYGFSNNSDIKADWWKEI